MRMTLHYSLAFSQRSCVTNCQSAGSSQPQTERLCKGMKRDFWPATLSCLAPFPQAAAGAGWRPATNERASLFTASRNFLPLTFLAAASPARFPQFLRACGPSTCLSRYRALRRACLSQGKIQCLLQRACECTARLWLAAGFLNGLRLGFL